MCADRISERYGPLYHELERHLSAMPAEAVTYTDAETGQTIRACAPTVDIDDEASEPLCRTLAAAYRCSFDMRDGRFVFTKK